MTKTLKYLTVLTMLIIIFSAVKSLGNIIVPVILSLFITVILNPFVYFLQKRNIPRLLAVSVLLLSLFITAFVLIVYLGTAINEFAKTLPLYRTFLIDTLQNLSTFLQGFGLYISIEEIIQYIDPTKAIFILTKTVSQLSNAIIWVVLVFIIVAFMLLESELFSLKFKSMLSHDEKLNNIILELSKGQPPT